MPVIDGRIVCCTCGADLGDAEDPYRDPTCAACELRWALADSEAEEQARLEPESQP